MIVCPKCQTRNQGRAKFCENCGRNLGAELEADDAIEEMLLKEARKGAAALGIVAGIQVITVFLIDPGSWILWTIAGVFGGLAVWAMYAPLVASAIGLAVFVGLHGLDAIADPSTLFKGIIMKVVVIGMLIGAVKNGLNHREFQSERSA